MIKSEILLQNLIKPIKPFFLKIKRLCCICDEEFIAADRVLECIKIFHKWSKCWANEKPLTQIAYHCFEATYQ